MYKITQAGNQVLKEDIQSITISYFKKFDEFKKWQANVASNSKNSADVVSKKDVLIPEEVIGDAIKYLHNKLSLDLFDILKSKTAGYFEFFVLKLL